VLECLSGTWHELQEAQVVCFQLRLVGELARPAVRQEERRGSEAASHLL
jgi:hypothetical protein